MRVFKHSCPPQVCQRPPPPPRLLDNALKPDQLESPGSVNLSKEDTQMAKRHVKMSSTSPTVRGTQLKPRRAVTPCLSEWPPSTSRQTARARAGENVEEREPALACCRWERDLAQPCWKTVWGSSEIKTGRPQDPASPLPGAYLKKSKTLRQKDIRTSRFTAGCLQWPKYGSDLSAHQ